MAPQTRNTAKPSPGRTTRNSVYGRPSPSPAKPRKSLAIAATAHDPEVKSKAPANVNDATKGTPWISCRDGYGILTSVTMSETGEGIHIRWYYPEDDREVDEDEEADVHMSVDNERGITPPTTTGPSDAVRRPFPQTPMPLYAFDAGSVIRTPVKKAKPLQPSPPRIGDKGIRCLYEKGGVLRELNGGARVTLRHPVGSSANLTREQVERLEDEREEQIFRVQVQKLLEQKQRAEEERERFSDNGYQDEMATDASFEVHAATNEGTNGTLLITHGESPNVTPTASVGEIERALGFYKGPNGELLDQHDRQILGQEGTILIDPAYGSPRRIRREEAFLIPQGTTDYFGPNRLRRARLGPHGTELID